MRAAAILGLGCSAKDLKPFQVEKSIEWRMGLPAASDQVDVILLFGGDGTIHRHLGQVVRLGLPWWCWLCLLEAAMTLPGHWDSGVCVIRLQPGRSSAAVRTMFVSSIWV